MVSERPAATPREESLPDVPRINRRGLVLPTAWTEVVDVLFDDARVFSISPRTGVDVRARRRGRRRVEWPPALEKFLRGSQTTSTIIRSLALGELDKKSLFKPFWHELRVGLLLGLAMGLVAYWRAILWQTGEGVALTVAIAMAWLRACQPVPTIASRRASRRASQRDATPEAAPVRVCPRRSPSMIASGSEVFASNSSTRKRAPCRDVAYTFAASLPHTSDPADRECSSAPRTDARARAYYARSPTERLNDSVHASA